MRKLTICNRIICLNWIFGLLGYIVPGKKMQNNKFIATFIPKEEKYNRMGCNDSKVQRADLTCHMTRIRLQCFEIWSIGQVFKFCRSLTLVTWRFFVKLRLYYLARNLKRSRWNLISCMYNNFHITETFLNHSQTVCKIFCSIYRDNKH